jgi:hypothetical protein
LRLFYVGEWVGNIRPFPLTFIGKGKECNDEMD